MLWRRDSIDCGGARGGEGAKGGGEGRGGGSVRGGGWVRCMLGIEMQLC